MRYTLGNTNVAVLNSFLPTTYGPIYILSRATFPGAPSYAGVRTWVEGSQPTLNTHVYAILITYKTSKGVSRDNIQSF